MKRIIANSKFWVFIVAVCLHDGVTGKSIIPLASPGLVRLIGRHHVSSINRFKRGTILLASSSSQYDDDDDDDDDENFDANKNDNDDDDDNDDKVENEKRLLNIASGAFPTMTHLPTSNSPLRRRPIKLSKNAKLYDPVMRPKSLNPAHTPSRWSNRILLANIVIYALQVIMPSVTRAGMKLSDRIRSGQQLYRLFTPMFLHGGITHLGSNMMSLQAVGPAVEEYFGSSRFLLTYLFAGVVGNLASAFYSPNPSLGASGAVFGMIGAYFYFLANNGQTLFGYWGTQGQLRPMLSSIAFNLFAGWWNPMVDQSAHVGGLLGGVYAAHVLGPRIRRITYNPPSGQRRVIWVDDPLVQLPDFVENMKLPAFLENIKMPAFVKRGLDNFNNWLPQPKRGGGRRRRPRKRLTPNQSVPPSRNARIHSIPRRGPLFYQ